MCLHFREVFVLWDAAFSLWTVNPMKQDIVTYQWYVLAAVQGNAVVRCTITAKVHLMLKHIAWQMGEITGGLGDKMEDWVEWLHQTRMHLQQQFHTIQNPIGHAHACERVSLHSSYSDVITHTNATNAGNKHSFSITKVMTQLQWIMKSSATWGDLRQWNILNRMGRWTNWPGWC